MQLFIKCINTLEIKCDQKKEAFSELYLNCTLYIHFPAVGWNSYPMSPGSGREDGWMEGWIYIFQITVMNVFLKKTYKQKSHLQ